MNRNEYIDYLRQFGQIIFHEFLNAMRLLHNQVPKEQLPHTINIKLQYLDIITQRQQHLIDTHEKVMSLYIDDIFKESFLKLQYFQFSIMVFDLFEAMSVIEVHLSIKNNQTTLPLQDDRPVFTNRQTILDLSEKIKHSLRTHAGNVRFIRVPALTSKQIQICRQLYTMESERLVLDWYVKNSTGKFAELLKVYESWLQGDSNTSIELFDND